MKQSDFIPFNKPHLAGSELSYLETSLKGLHLTGDGPFTKKCHEWLENNFNCKKALLTHSCTSALEMTAMALQLQPGDEVIMPSYTFVSTANAFVLRGAIPVFIDIRPDTMNMDETKLEASITDKTKAIVVVHYAGISCEMNTIMEIAENYNIDVIEDAAQCVGSSYQGRALGNIGTFGALSFHATKNIIAGEGGALLVNRHEHCLISEIIREKGTDRSSFLRGEVDKYTWQNIGSSYLPSDLIAAFLWAQLEQAETINAMRMRLWNYYHRELKSIETLGLIRRPSIPFECKHNAHMYYVILAEGIDRTTLIRLLKENGIQAVSHYVPLHNSPAGNKFGRSGGSLSHTESIADRLLRLPLWADMTEIQLAHVIEQFSTQIRKIAYTTDKEVQS